LANAFARKAQLCNAKGLAYSTRKGARGRQPPTHRRRFAVTDAFRATERQHVAEL